MDSRTADRSTGLDFLWLELTNRCNLQCVHCYSDSHPGSGDRDLLSAAHYERLMADAFALGCRKLQLIGGEPQLSPHFDHLLRRAKSTGFEFIEVFSNLTRLTEETLDYCAGNDIAFATSVYSDEPAVHDGVTTVKGSHARTVRNLRRLLSRGVTVRAAVIAIGQDQEEIGRTTAFLKGLGVPTVRVGDLREFGRGQEILAQSARLSGLCGQCWKGRLCVGPDGTAYPCVMAREWPVGNVLDQELAQIVGGEPLGRMRRTIREEVWQPRTHACVPDSCPQSCQPDECPQSCDPNQFCAPDVEPICGPDSTCLPDELPEIH